MYISLTFSGMLYTTRDTPMDMATHPLGTRVYYRYGTHGLLVCAASFFIALFLSVALSMHSFENCKSERTNIFRLISMLFQEAFCSVIHKCVILDNLATTTKRSGRHRHPQADGCCVFSIRHGASSYNGSIHLSPRRMQPKICPGTMAYALPIGFSAFVTYCGSRLYEAQPQSWAYSISSLWAYT